MLIKNLSNASAKILFDFGFDANADINGEQHKNKEHISWFQFTPLMYAASMGNISLVAELVKHGANLNVRDDFFEFTALMWASHKGRDKVVELLLQAHSTINTKAGYDETMKNSYELSKKSSCCNWARLWKRVDEFSSKVNFNRSSISLNKH